MIKSITFKKDFRCFAKGDKFEFKPGVNVIVGDQGSGKSTLIELIRMSFEKTKGSNDSSWRGRTLESNLKDIDKVISLDNDEGTRVIAIDFERESIRDMSQMLYDQMDLQLFGMKSSHGQANLAMLNRFLGKVVKDNKISTVLMDEPDAALSLRSCYLLIGAIHKLATKFGKQVIVSAHNPIIINGKHPLVKDSFWSEVLDLEMKKWLTADTFITLQVAPNKEPKKSK